MILCCGGESLAMQARIASRISGSTRAVVGRPRPRVLELRARGALAHGRCRSCRRRAAAPRGRARRGCWRAAGSARPRAGRRTRPASGPPPGRSCPCGTRARARPSRATRDRPRRRLRRGARRTVRPSPGGCAAHAATARGARAHADASFGITSVPHSRSWRSGELRNEMRLRTIRAGEAAQMPSHVCDAMRYLMRFLPFGTAGPRGLERAQHPRRRARCATPGGRAWSHSSRGSS